MTAREIEMLWLAKPFMLTAAIAGLNAVAAVPAKSSEPAIQEVGLLSRAENDMENAVLNFLVTSENFEAFRQVATYRRSSRLEVLPGFPENPGLVGSVQALAQDEGTRQRLATADLTPRDYILVGWAMILAHDPEEWGLNGDTLSANMRQNLRFVEAHRASIDALLND
jgi:hypothetical protein